MKGSKSPFARSETGLDGLIVVDKPSGMTSHDVVARVRRITRTKRVGHTGTLDPMATGVLVLCLGKATRLIPFIEEQGGEGAKEYVADIRFGFETSTDDAEGDVRGSVTQTDGLSHEMISNALKAFTGTVLQVPPAFSARKVDGERAYDRARRGEDVQLQATPVSIETAQLMAFEGSVARARFSCSRGTYVRALARDLGRSLGVGAHLVGLRRTRSGRASLEGALILDSLDEPTLKAALVPMAGILETWPKLVATHGQVAEIQHGRSITTGSDLVKSPTDRFRICSEDGRLVALAEARDERFHPFCVF